MFLCSKNSPGKNTGVNSHTHLQGIFPTQGSNLGLLYFRQFLYQLNHQRRFQGAKTAVICYTALEHIRASLVAQLVKNLPAMWETWFPSLGWEDPLEKGKATHSSILAWRIPWTI